MRECISFAPQGRVWHFRQGGLDVTQAVSARLITDQVQVARTACVDGLGIARLLHYQVADELASGRLVRLLRVFEPEDQPVQVVYPHAKLLAPRVREFIDWACPELQRSIPSPN